MSDGYWWHQFSAKLDAEDRDRREWIEDVKHRLGIRCIGDEGEPPVPEWPVLDLEPGTTYSVVSDHAMASWDGVHFYVKPDGMTMAEWRDSLR